MKALFKKHFIFKSSSVELFVADRCSLGNKIYHSEFYIRRGRINSYSVSFSHDNTKKFGDIQKFFSIKGVMYAIIKTYPVINDVNILPKTSIQLNSLVPPSLFLRFYNQINSNNFHFLIIECNQIVHRCLYIHNNKQSFFSELVYEVEHD